MVLKAANAASYCAKFERRVAYDTVIPRIARPEDRGHVRPPRARPETGVARDERWKAAATHRNVPATVSARLVSSISARLGSLLSPVTLVWRSSASASRTAEPASFGRSSQYVLRFGYSLPQSISRRRRRTRHANGWRDPLRLGRGRGVPPVQIGSQRGNGSQDEQQDNALESLGLAVTVSRRGGARSLDGVTRDMGTPSRTGDRSHPRHRRADCWVRGCRRRAAAAETETLDDWSKDYSVTAGEGTQFDVGHVVLEPPAIRKSGGSAAMAPSRLPSPTAFIGIMPVFSRSRSAIFSPVKFNPGTPVRSTATRSPRSVSGASVSIGVEEVFQAGYFGRGISPHETCVVARIGPVPTVLRAEWNDDLVDERISEP